MKKFALMLSIVLLLGACTAAKTTNTTSDPTTNTSDQTGQTQKTFTLSQLAAYNGKNGAKAYVAYDGIVYDVSSIGAWDTGTHQGIKAGTDITSAFSNSPHSVSLVKGLPVIGTLTN